MCTSKTWLGWIVALQVELSTPNEYLKQGGAWINTKIEKIEISKLLLIMALLKILELFLYKGQKEKRIIFIKIKWKLEA